MTSWAPVISGILVGAASGIGGAVAGAWMNRKSQLVALRLNISAEENRIRLIEKRRLYAQITQKITELTATIEAYSGQDRENGSRIERNDLGLASATFTHLINETSLIAPDDLTGTLSKLHDRLFEYTREAQNGTRNIKVSDNIRGLADEIIREMRKDLGT